jgi:2-iminobutanoate/2-iminopropanoate deaminase
MNRHQIQVPGIGNPQWYSSATRFGDLIWTAGEVPLSDDQRCPETLAGQVELTLDHLQATLEAAGGGFDTLIKVNTYLASLADFEAYNAVYVERLAPYGLPPRTTVAIAQFPGPIRIEIEAVAHVRGSG